MDWSLDHVGPMTRSVWDAAALLQAIAGHDPADTELRWRAPVPDYLRAAGGGARGLRLGLLRRFYVDWPGLDAEVRAAALAAFDVLTREGATIQDVDAPILDLAPAIWSCFLAEMYEYHREMARRAPEKYREGTRIRLYMGALVSAQDFLRAQRLRVPVPREIDALLDTVDALVFPGQAGPAQRFEEISSLEVMAPVPPATRARGISSACPRWRCRRASRARGCRCPSRSWDASATTPPCSASPAPTSAPPTGTGGVPIPRAGGSPDAHRPPRRASRRSASTCSAPWWTGAPASFARGEALGRAKGLDVDWVAFTDAWRGLYQPALDKVRSGAMPWTRLDDLHRMSLDRLLDEFEIRGLGASARSTT